MGDLFQSEHPKNALEDKISQEKPVPHGIGMAVAFDWGLAVQIFVMPLLPYFLRDLVSLKPASFQASGLKLASSSPTLVSFLISLPFVALLVVFGESMRRGWRWGRRIQIIVNALGFLGGLVSLVHNQPTFWGKRKLGPPHYLSPRQGPPAGRLRPLHPHCLTGLLTLH